MVKCIQLCLVFLKRLLNLKSRPSTAPKADPQEVQVNSEGVNITSINDREPGIKENIEIHVQIQNAFRSDGKNSSIIMSNSNNVVVVRSDSLDECCLSPISKRSQSEDFSPVKIPSPKSSLRIIKDVFYHENEANKPKIYAATPRMRVPRSMNRVMQKINFGQ